MNLLEELGTKYMPSKRQHDYLRHYYRHFGDRRLEVKKFLEIGVDTGASLRMWEEFFPNAVIHGFDKNPDCKRHESGRIKIYIGDQYNGSSVGDFVVRNGGMDIIIDDGSHLAEHQVATFRMLFPTLTTHGIYAVEDMGGCVGDTGLVAVRGLLGMVDDIMYWPKGLHPSKWSSLHTLPQEAGYYARHVVGMSIYRWLMIINKGHNPGDNPYLIR